MSIELLRLALQRGGELPDMSDVVSELNLEIRRSRLGKWIPVEEGNRASYLRRAAMYLQISPWAVVDWLIRPQDKNQKFGEVEYDCESRLRVRF